MAVAGFNTILESAAQADVFTGVLPFVITYTIFFYTMKKVGSEGNPLRDDKVAGIVSIGAAFYVARFIALNPAYQQFFVNYFGRLTIGIIGVLGLLVVLAMVGWDVSKMPGKGGLFGWLLAGIALAAFTVSGGISAFIPYELSQAGPIIDALMFYLLDQGLIWILLIVGSLLWVTGGDNSGENDDSGLAPIFWNRNGNAGSGEGSND